MPRRNGTGPSFGRGQGRRRRRQCRGRKGQKNSLNPPEVCACSKCGYLMPHKGGVPCSTITCPRCGALMSRD